MKCLNYFLVLNLTITTSPTFDLFLSYRIIANPFSSTSSISIPPSVASTLECVFSIRDYVGWSTLKLVQFTWKHIQIENRLPCRNRQKCFFCLAYCISGLLFTFRKSKTASLISLASLNYYVLFFGIPFVI